MKVTVFSAQTFEQPYLVEAANGQHSFCFHKTALSLATAQLAAGTPAVSIFTNDDASAPVLRKLHAWGVRYICTRAAGYDNIDLAEAQKLGIRVANVPEYSPYAIAEHTIVLILALNRQLIKANQQVHDFDFRLDNLVGFDLHGKTVGIIGLGRIGGVVARILHGFGCHLLGYDPAPNRLFASRFGVNYVSLDELCSCADIITIHAPLNAHTHHLINAQRISQMKRGVMVINTGRGGVLDTAAAIVGLEEGQIGYLGLDVYEKEKGLFFYDHQNDQVKDSQLSRLLSMPNVLITGHQAFLTQTALQNITQTTCQSLDAWASGHSSTCELIAFAPEEVPENAVK